MRSRNAFIAAICVSSIALTATIASQSGTGSSGEWRDYAGDKGFTKYSPLDQINKDNVKNLRIAWRRPGVADELRAKDPSIRYGNTFRTTPLMIGGVLYAQNGVGLVEAFDPETGKTIWVQEHAAGEQLRGQPMRGIAYWRDSAGGERLLTVRGSNLIALDLKTGQMIRSFGTDGRADLIAGQGARARSYNWTFTVV